MRVVVVGGGFGGMAAAARLAKMGHQVTLVERSTSLGGALGRIEVEGHIFDTGPTHTLLPAVVRDLFRKSGRPLERETELVPLDVVREHRFADGTRLRLTGGSRAAQKAEFETLAPGLGDAWVKLVDPYGTVWERLRRDWIERPWNPDLAHPETTRLLAERATLAAHLERALPDARARLVAAHPHTVDGHDLTRVPVWAGMHSYLEQNFGVWTVPGGLGALGDLMGSRMKTRKVEVLTDTAVLDVVVREGRAVAVRTADGEIDADAVVVGIDPRHLPSLRRFVRGTATTSLPDQLHLGLRPGSVLADQFGDELVGDLVLHGPRAEADVATGRRARRGAGELLLVRPSGSAPDDGRAVTVVSRGIAAEQVLDTLAARGVDLRDDIVLSIHRSGTDLAQTWGGSPLGLAWDGRRTVRRRPGARTPIAGLHMAGAHATPGSGVPFTGLSGSLVAQAIGPA
ncbi:phytoene desaturase family protein [Nocardioides yefusunii]|uniref:Phytoene desaturase family protein n=1 Tax=Nocardioides yefusunii TaxID=2500546 RepID=A0ABW1QUW7_9ACTN|nr:FAD-dependent oxidoreductase [Nocardioides yefusunii]